MKCISRVERRASRHRRIRRKVVGTSERPRMAIMISNKNIVVQFIDDDKGVTLASASTLKSNARPNREAASVVGREAAEAAVAKGIKQVVVDRGGFRYAGRVCAVTEAAIKAGLSTGAAVPAAEPEADKETKKET